MNILVSACLLGFDVKYDGGNNGAILPEETFERLKKIANIIPGCAECMGGLSCPRSPCEISGEKVIDSQGNDRTLQFKKGAQQVLKAAKMFGCSFALLKERSPSCGSGKIYDGSFSHKIIDGNGITTDLLLKNGIKVFGETQIEELFESLRLAKAPLQLSFAF